MNKNVYARPNKPMFIDVKDRNKPPDIQLPDIPKPITVDSATECFVTPKDVAARMADYLGDCTNMSVLEPSAGMGNLVSAVLDQEFENLQLSVVERHYSLFDVLDKKFSNQPQISLYHGCFIDLSNNVKDRLSFDKIIMNPPFKKVRQHMEAALSLLRRDDEAQLVALVPITYQHEQAELLEILPPTTFTGIQVNTKIVIFYQDDPFLR